MYDNYSLSKRLSELRTQAGVSQEKLAEEADISAKYISQMERGLKCPTVKTLSKICDALGITLSDFFDEKTKADDTAFNFDRLQHFISRRTQSERKSIEEFLKLIEQCIKNK